VTKLKKVVRDMKALKELVLQEVSEEEIESAKKRYAFKVKEIRKARKVVKNLERELEDLEMEIGNELFS